MTSQPVSSILFLFFVLYCPLGLAELQACPFLGVVFPPLLLSALSPSPFHCALQDDFGQTWWTGDISIALQFASFYDGQVFARSDCLHRLPRCLYGFCMRCVASCGSTSIPWLVFVIEALLWGSIINKHTERLNCQRSALVVSWNREKCCRHSKLVSTWSMLCRRCYPGEYLRLGTLVR